MAAPVAAKPTMAEVTAEEAKPAISVGDTVIHRVWQEGTVVSGSGSVVKVRFETVGEKILGLSWMTDSCEIKKNS